MNKILIALSFALTFSLTAAQAEDITSSQVANLAAVSMQTDADVCAERFIEQPGEQATDDSEVEQTRCCKVCKKGKACGDSCIARSKTCHKGVGCACNG